MVKCPFGGEAPAVFNIRACTTCCALGMQWIRPQFQHLCHRRIHAWSLADGERSGLRPALSNTFMSQVTAVIPVLGQPEAFIFVANRWHEPKLEQSTQFFLPININGPGDIAVYWYDRWDLSYFQRHLSCGLTQLGQTNSKGEAKIRLRLVNTGKSLSRGVSCAKPTDSRRTARCSAWIIPSG